MKTRKGYPYVSIRNILHILVACVSNNVESSSFSAKDLVFTKDIEQKHLAQAEEVRLFLAKLHVKPVRRELLNWFFLQGQWFYNQIIQQHHILPFMYIETELVLGNGCFSF